MLSSFLSHCSIVLFSLSSAKHTVDGAPAEGIATIDIAVETLKVAEYLTPVLAEQLK